MKNQKHRYGTQRRRVKAMKDRKRSIKFLEVLAFLFAQSEVPRVHSFSAVHTSNRASTPSPQIAEKYNIEILSKDPKCFIVHDLLSAQECDAYIAKADNTDPQLMKRSNAPQVSVQVDRLWPLPFLCLGAGVPPIIRLFEGTDDPSTVGLTDIVNKALPPVAIALGVVASLILIITKTMQNYAANSSRTSQSLALNTEKDCEFIQSLVDRCSEITDHKWNQWEAPVVTKYDEGALFAAHNDASPTKGSEWADLGGQRVVTVITYLNTCIRGGGTKFDQLGFTVQPKKGSALVFFPADDHTLEADGRTVHQSIAAVEDKYIVQLFGRCRRVPSPLGIPDVYVDLHQSPTDL